MTTAQIAERMGKPHKKMYGYLARQHLWGKLRAMSERDGGTRSAHEHVMWSLPND